MRLVVCLALAAGPFAAADAGIATEVRRDAGKLLNEGVAAYNRGDARAAVASLERCVAVALNSFRAHHYLGLALIADRQYERAIGALAIALDLSPEDVPSLIAVGDARLKLGDVQAARAAYYRALRARPAAAAALDGLARAYESRSDTEAAIEHYRLAIVSDRGFAPAYTHLGDLYLRQERIQEAVRLMEEAVDIRPDYATGLNRLAVAYGELGLEDRAVATIWRAMELAPDNPDHPTTLGILQLAIGSIAGAEEAFRQALALEPGHAEARLGLAEVFRRRGRYDDALAATAAGLATPNVAATLGQRHETMAELLALERREVDALEARTADGSATPEDHAELARIAAARGDWAMAVEHESLAGDDAGQRERLAYAMFRSGRYRIAESIYRDLARETGDARMQFNEAVVLATLGDDDRAAATFRQIVASNPELIDAHVYLGNALLRQGREREAAESYRNFLDADGRGESAEQVRRILLQVAPELVPGPANSPLPLPDPPRPAPRQARQTRQTEEVP